MSPIIVHGIPGSPYMRMPLLACEEKGVAWRLAPIKFGDNKAPEHLARHPFGRVPVIEHEDFVLYECQAIVRYIDEAFAGPSLTPADARAAARMSQVMNIVDWYVMPSLSSGISWNRLVAADFGLPVDEAAVTAAIPLARTAVKALEDILEDKPYFTGDRVTLADLMAVAHLDYAPRSPEGAEIFAGSPLLAWLDRMRARPSLQATTAERLKAQLQTEPA